MHAGGRLSLKRRHSAGLVLQTRRPPRSRIHVGRACRKGRRPTGGGVAVDVLRGLAQPADMPPAGCMRGARATTEVPSRWRAWAGFAESLADQDPAEKRSDNSVVQRNRGNLSRRRGGPGQPQAARQTGRKCLARQRLEAGVSRPVSAAQQRRSGLPSVGCRGLPPPDAEPSGSR